MANVYGKESGSLKPQFSHAYGNAFNESFTATSVAQIADILFLGRIPAGTRVTRFDLVLATGPASATCKIGYQAADGSGNPATVDNYWFTAGTGLTTAARTASIAQPIEFKRDVDIIATIAGAATNGSAITVDVGGVVLGVK